MTKARNPLGFRAFCCRFRWWRGQDLNLRPSGYEISDRNLIPYQCVPDRALELAFRRSLYPCRANPYTPVPRRTVEGTVEGQAHRSRSAWMMRMGAAAGEWSVVGVVELETLRGACRSIFGLSPSTGFLVAPPTPVRLPAASRSGGRLSSRAHDCAPRIEGEPDGPPARVDHHSCRASSAKPWMSWTSISRPSSVRRRPDQVPKTWWVSDPWSRPGSLVCLS
jgi:hypothetical protein